MRAARSQLVVVWIVLFLGPCLALAAEPARRSILVLDQSEAKSAFYNAVFFGLRSTVSKASGEPVNIYIETFDLSRFKSELYEASLKSHLRTKYTDRQPGVIVTVGGEALKMALRWRAELWPNVPLVFSLVSEQTISRLNPGPDVTGSLVRLRFEDMLTAARAVVPDLTQLALVGDAWDTQTVYGDLKDEIPAATDGVAIIDLVGLPMSELRTRVAALPPRTAIAYTGIYSDGHDTFYSPLEALGHFADVANAPIVGTAETFVGPGAIGGFVMMPARIGQEAGQLALRILDGESASQIPVTLGNSVQPVFDWRQMQRWGVKESDLPPDSEIRFREPGLWERYAWQMAAIVAITGLQSLLITALLYQRRGRRAAEGNARQRMTELAHVNRQATVGQLSASIAHELNQPLGSIYNNVEAATLNLSSPNPNLEEIGAILHDIKRDDQRASEVIRRLRRFLTLNTVERHEMDLNEAVREVFGILSMQAAARDVRLHSKLTQQRLRVKGDPIQIQQVILNLVVNGIEAVSGASNGIREIVCTSWASDRDLALLSIRDSGPGIAPDHLEKIFEPFFTTKEQGMGMGLCISRTIIEAHGGSLSVEGRPNGAVFHIHLPLAQLERT